MYRYLTHFLSVCKKQQTKIKELFSSPLVDKLIHSERENIKVDDVTMIHLYRIRDELQILKSFLWMVDFDYAGDVFPEEKRAPLKMTLGEYKKYNIADITRKITYEISSETKVVVNLFDNIISFAQIVHDSNKDSTEIDKGIYNMCTQGLSNTIQRFEKIDFTSGREESKEFS